jgi:hypothetical protein
MTEEEACKLQPGQRVSLGVGSSKEYGIVACTYLDAGIIEVYAVFFGSSYPDTDKRPSCRPYLLRYYGTSLDLVP